MNHQAATLDRPKHQNFEVKIQKWLPLLAWSGLLGLLVFQAWFYYCKLPLSLGPRVILQPWLMQHGFVLYENIADMHSPLMPLIITTLRPLIPDGLKLAKLVLITLLSLTTLLTFIVGRRKIGWLGGLWAAWFFVVWSPTFGFGKLWYESFLAPLYLLWLLVDDLTADPRSAKSLLILGFLGGVAVLVKQHAVVVLLALVLWNAFTNWCSNHSRTRILREIGLIGLAAILPVAAYVIYQYTQAGSLGNFWYWTLGYSLTSDFRTLATLRPSIPQLGVIASSCLLIPAAIFCWVDSKRKGNDAWRHLGGGMVLLVASSVTTYPLFLFFHLQATLPLLALVSSLTLAYALRRQNSGRLFVAGIALALSAFWLITAGYDYRLAFKVRPKPKIEEYSELVPLAQKIRQYIGPTDCIYIFLDGEDTANLYYLAGCSPPKFWIFHYPYYMLDRIKKRIISTLEDDPPPWIVYFPDRWNVEKRAPEIVDYLQKHYRRETSFSWERGEVWLLRRLS